MSKKPMTQDLWDRLFWLHFKAARRREPTADLEQLRERVVWAMDQTFGPRPDRDPEPGALPWWVRLGLKLVPGKEKLSMEVKPLFLALVFGLVAGAGALQIAVGDNTVSMQEWVGVAMAFLSAFWGKLSNPNKVVSTKPDA